MRTRTKIICTIGPAVSRYEKILEMIDAGMNVARLNFSHGTHEDHLKVIQDLKRARKERKIPLAIMIDTKGPEIRLGKLKNNEVSVVPKQRILLVKEEIEGDDQRWQVTPGIVLDKVEKGTTILFDDGYVISTVVEKKKEGLVVEILNSGTLKTFKGVNIPGVDLPIPAMTDQDVEDIRFGCKHDVDIIAASFIRSKDHVQEIKALLKKEGKPEILVMSKIENSLGVKNFEAILAVSDGIMVARGDLGVELPLKQVPALQKMMIRKCTEAGKPVVTATQMLESMIKNPRPTRAEVSDVANAIYDCTSCVMLSGETAVGLYPIEAIQMMKSIAEETEKNLDYRAFFQAISHTEFQDVSTSISLASVKTAYSASGKAIFAFTVSGSTARLISRCRPEIPILALTPHEKVYHQMAFNWGVIPIDPTPTTDVEEAFVIAREFALKNGIVKKGDLAVLTAGSPFAVSGTTNTLIVKKI